MFDVSCCSTVGIAPFALSCNFGDIEFLKARGGNLASLTARLWIPINVAQLGSELLAFLTLHITLVGCTGGFIFAGHCFADREPSRALLG